MGGSILPVTVHNNELYFLFGKERDIDENPGWSDFGGGTDKGETFIQTAIREGSEELTGFLGSNIDIKKLLKKYGTYNIDYDSQGHTTYRCHIFPMDFDASLPYYYNNNQRFLQQKLDPTVIRDTKIFEKVEIKWFSFNDIKKNKNTFRSFYQNIVQLILDNSSQIQQFVSKASLNNKTNNRKKSVNKTKTRTRKAKGEKLKEKS